MFMFRNDATGSKTYKGLQFECSSEQGLGRFWVIILSEEVHHNNTINLIFEEAADEENTESY